MKKERKERAKEEDALEDVLREVERDREGEDALAWAVSRGRAARDKGAAEEADKDGRRGEEGLAGPWLRGGDGGP